MGSLQIFINAIIVALMAMYVYKNERKMEEMSARHSQTENEINLVNVVAQSKEVKIEDLEQLLSTKAETRKLTEIENQLLKLEEKGFSGDMKVSTLEKELDKLKILVESKEDAKTIQNLIKDMKQLIATKTGTDKLAEIEKQQQKGRDQLAEIEKQQKVGKDKLAEIEKQQKVGKDKLAEIEKQQKLGTHKLAEIEKQLNDKGVPYIRWGKKLCEGPNSETIYSGQVGGGRYTHAGASVNYICLPNNPEVAQPLKSNDAYAFLYGGEYEIFGQNQPQGIRSGIGEHDVACAACITKGKVASIMIPGRKTCYNGWTKEYEGILMAGKHNHPAASEYACVDRDAEALAGGSQNEEGILFYPVKTQCGSLKCPPYRHDTAVFCVVCSK